MEREAAKRRNLDTQERLRKAGRFTGGAIPYGTRLVSRVGEDGSVGRYLETEPAEAERLREVASRLIRGDSLRAVTAYVNAQGSARPKGLPVVALDRSFNAPLSPPGATCSTPRPPRSGGPPHRKGQGREGQTRTSDDLPLARPREVRRMRRGAHDARAHAQRNGIRRYTCPSVAKVTPCPERVGIEADAADAVVEEQFIKKFGHFEHEEPRDAERRGRPECRRGGRRRRRGGPPRRSVARKPRPCPRGSRRPCNGAGAPNPTGDDPGRDRQDDPRGLGRVRDPGACGAPRRRDRRSCCTPGT